MKVEVIRGNGDKVSGGYKLEVTKNGKPFYKSKTIAFNTTALITGLIMILQGIENKNYNSINQGIVMCLMAIVNYVLRFVTKEPIKFRG